MAFGVGYHEEPFHITPVLPYAYALCGMIIFINALYACAYFYAKDLVAPLQPAIADISSSIPVINKPYRFLIEDNNPERAELVANIYGFNWLAFFFLLPLTIMAALYTGWKVYDEYKEMYVNEGLSRRLRKKNFLRIIVCVVGLIWILDELYNGHFQFGNRPCSANNCVHIRNFDLMRLVFFQLGFAIFLFYLMFFITTTKILIKKG